MDLIYYDGVTNGAINFSVRADGQGYFAGNVGIGTSSPTAPIHVYSSSANILGLFISPTPSILIAGNRNSTASLDFGRDATAVGYNIKYHDGFTSGNTYLTFGTAGVDRVAIDQNGKVGIGTTSPSALLDLGQTAGVKQLIYGSGGNSGYYMGLGVNLGQAPNSLTAFIGPPGGDGSSGDATFSVSSGTSTWPYSAYTTRFVVYSSGGVGIGTATIPKGYKFAVNGSAIATSMTVQLNANWPDYVFKKSFRLPSLKSLKTYIDKNQHLPEMPSAGEIENDGLNLGEMNKLLVKKVEELTLYLIKL